MGSVALQVAQQLSMLGKQSSKQAGDHDVAGPARSLSYTA
jgi:hypothetical protein